MALNIVGGLMCLLVCIGPVVVLVALITPASEGRKAMLLPLYGVGLLVLPLLFFAFNSVDGISSSVVVALFALAIAVACIRAACIFLIQANTQKAFAKQLELFALRKKP